MRSHAQIISEAGGPTRLANLLGLAPGTVKQWRRTSSIPGAYWKALKVAGLATLDELASASAKLTGPVGHGGGSSVDDPAVVAPGSTCGAEKSVAVFSPEDAA